MSSPSRSVPYSPVFLLLNCAAIAGCEGHIQGPHNDASPDARTVADSASADVTRVDASTLDSFGPAPDADVDSGGRDVAQEAAAPEPERICEPWPAPADSFDQTVVPVEIEPRNRASKKIVIVAGAPSTSHGPGEHQFFAVSALLAKVLCQTPGVVPVLVRGGWPTRESVFEGAAAIVFYADGGASHPLESEAHRATLRPLINAGVGFANLHYAVEYGAQSATEARAWLGGVYETGYSVNPMWRANFASISPHPITRGVVAFEIEDEWYYSMRWVADTSALAELLRATPPDATRTTSETMAHPGRAETTAWAYVRPGGGRSFGFTGGHWYGNWVDSADTPNAPMQRRVVAQGVLWSAGVEIPMDGVSVAFSQSENGRWLDRR